MPVYSIGKVAVVPISNSGLQSVLIVWFPVEESASKRVAGTNAIRPFWVLLNTLALSTDKAVGNDTAGDGTGLWYGSMQ